MAQNKTLDDLKKSFSSKQELYWACKEQRKNNNLVLQRILQSGCAFRQLNERRLTS